VALAHTGGAGRRPQGPGGDHSCEDDGVTRAHRLEERIRAATSAWTTVASAGLQLGSGKDGHEAGRRRLDVD
jgi:hypothetical protein